MTLKKSENDSDASWEKARTLPLSETVYEALRESIVTLIDPPGALLTENAVANRYGVARPTAKGALERLVNEGLLRRTAHRAARVPQLTRADVEDLYATRLLLEEAAVISLAKRGLVPAAALAAQEQIVVFSDKSADAPFVQPDLAFHHEMVLGEGSPRLSRMHELIMGEIRLCMGQLQSHQLLRAKEISIQHKGIIEAIQARDPELAAFLIRRHIVNARDQLLTKFEERRAGRPELELFEKPSR